MLNLVEHSCSKGQFIRVAIKRIVESQTFEDELKEASELNEVLLGRNQEPEVWLVKEIWAKDGMYSPNSFSVESCSNNVQNWCCFTLSEFMDQLMAFGMILGDLDSAAKAFSALKEALVKEKVARQTAQTEVETLTWVVRDLKFSANDFAAQNPVLEEKVKHLDNKVINGLNGLRAQELSMQCITKANNDYKSQNAQLTRKLVSKLHWSPKPWLVLDISSWLTLFRLAESDPVLITLKAMVEIAVAFVYPNDSYTAIRAPQMLDSLPTQSREIILANMKQSMCLTLEILKSLYPCVNLDAVGEGFAATCNYEEAMKLIEDNVVMVGHIVDMLPVDMS
jgi:hypothetical protein